jgi:signal transduction histidine kinase
VAPNEANVRASGANLPERIFDAQRLENLGLLAAGIAHDLNNVLAPITMIPSLLRQRVQDPLDARMLDVLEQSAARASDLVRQILGFARGAAGQRHVLQVKYILRDLVGLLAETFPKNIVIEDSWEGDLWPVYGFPTQLHQTVLNLCINARDAMPGGGMLRIRAQNRVLDELAAATLEGSRPGAWVVIAVEDFGTGMTPDVVARVWEPFFTTKDEGKGSGLGLPMVRNLVEGHGGFVTLDTSVGRGSVFSVYLPAACGSAEKAVEAEPPLPYPHIVYGNWISWKKSWATRACAS